MRSARSQMTRRSFRLDRPRTRYERECPGELVHVDIKRAGYQKEEAGVCTGGPTSRARNDIGDTATTSCTPRSMTAPAWLRGELARRAQRHCFEVHHARAIALFAEGDIRVGTHYEREQRPEEAQPNA